VKIKILFFTCIFYNPHKINKSTYKTYTENNKFTFGEHYNKIEIIQ